MSQFSGFAITQEATDGVIGFEIPASNITDPITDTKIFTNGSNVQIRREQGKIYIGKTGPTGFIALLSVVINIPNSNLNAFVQDERIVVLPQNMSIHQTRKGRQITAQLLSGK